MSGRISDHLAQLWLDSLSTSWASLHHDNPDVAGAYASEVFGGGYGRQRVEFGAAANRAVFSVNAVTWKGLPATVVTHVGLWDAEINGNYLASIALVTPARVLAGKSLSYASGLIAVSLD